MAEKQKTLKVSPFITRVACSKQSEFDKYYLDPEYKEIYKKAGVDADGEEYGVIEIKTIIHKRDIAEYINSQADSVGVEAYMRALMVQGDSIDNYNTVVGEGVNDFTDCPDNLADTMLIGDKAKAAFEKLDPALKGSHTTIEGFLNSLTKDSIDAYIQGKVDAVFPKQEVVEGGNK